MKDIEKHYARVFNTPSGNQVLNHLHTITTQRVIGHNTSNEDLRWWAGQCALVHQIESLIQRGNNPTQ